MHVCVTGECEAECTIHSSYAFLMNCAYLGSLIALPRIQERLATAEAVEKLARSMKRILEERIMTAPPPPSRAMATGRMIYGSLSRLPPLSNAARRFSNTL